jgi:hypothetical protein
MKRFLALVLLAAMLLSGTGCSCSGSAVYANANSYTAGDAVVPANAVKAVMIDWASGDVILKNGTGELRAYESGGDALNEKDRMHWWLDGTTLRIHYCASGHMTTVRSDQKCLTVELPDFVDLDIDIASGKVCAENTLNLGTFRLDTASGGADIRALVAKEARIDSASGALSFGSVTVSGAFDVDTASGALTVERLFAGSVTVDAASGRVSIGLYDVGKVAIDTASGDVRLKLANVIAGARIRFDSASGRFRSDLPHTQDGKTYVIGLGAIDVSVDTASGSLTIE